MKKIVVLFMLCVSLCSLYMSFDKADNAAWNTMQHAGEDIARPFWIKQDLRLADPDEIYPLLREAAIESGVNVFRTSVDDTGNNHMKIVKYIMLTSDTHFFNAFALETGRFLTPSDTQNSHFFLSTVNTRQPNQSGVLKDFGGNHLLEVRPLKEAYHQLPVSDEYFVEASKSQNYDAFIRDFVGVVNAYFHLSASESYTPEAFLQNPGSSAGGAVEMPSNVKISAYVKYAMYVIALILLFYYSFYESKRMGVMKMHGISNVRLWFVTVGRLIGLSFVISEAITILMSLTIHDTTIGFIKSAILSQVQTFVVLTLISFISYIYIWRVRVSDAIKNRKDTDGIFAVNTLLKTICSISLIFAGVSVWNQYSAIHAKQVTLKGWQQSSSYGVFYPISNGNDLQDLKQHGGLVMTAAQTSGLYPVLNKMGSLYIDAHAYESQYLGLPMPKGYIRSITVNLNYLNQYRVYDAKNQRVHISNDTNDWVLLVPEKYRSEESVISDFFTKTRKSEYRWENVLEHKDAPQRIQNQDIKIFWIANGQKIFSFDPDVFPQDGNQIQDPVIQVQTDANSLPSDRMNGMSGSGAADPVKVRLINGDSERTLQTLQPLLKQLKLDDNMKHLVTVNQFVLQQEYSLQQAVHVVLLMGLGLAVGFFVFVVQNLTIFFNKHQRKFIVRRLFGSSFLQTYKEYLYILAITWLVQFMLCFIGGKANMGALPGNKLFLVVAILTAMEFLTSAVVFMTIETRNRVKVLKEGV